MSASGAKRGGDVKLTSLWAGIAVLGACAAPTPVEMTRRPPAFETATHFAPRDALQCVQRRLAEVKHPTFRPPTQQLIESERGLELWADAPQGPPFSSVVGTTQRADGTTMLRWYDGKSSLAVCDMCRRWYQDALQACR